MTNRHDSYPANSEPSEPEIFSGAATQQNKDREGVVDRRTLFGILGVGAAAAAGIAFLAGRGSAENNTALETIRISKLELRNNPISYCDRNATTHPRASRAWRTKQ